MKFSGIIVISSLLFAGAAFAAVSGAFQPIAGPIFAPITVPAQVDVPPQVVPGPTLVSNSDGIAVGTVTNIQHYLTQNQWWAYPGGSGPNMVQVMQVTVKVNQALLGMDGINTFQLTIPLSPYPGDPNTTAANALKVGDQDLFGLQQTKDGYNLAAGTLGILGTDKVDEIAKLVKNRPLTITSTLAGNLYFGKYTTMTLKVKNNSDTAYRVNYGYLNGYYLAKRMENAVLFSVSLDGKLNAGRFPENPVSIPAHEEREISFFVSTMAPPSMAILGPDSYLMAPISLRATINFSPGDGKPTDIVTQHITQSPYIIVYAGYPLTPPVTQQTTMVTPPPSIDASGTNAIID